MASGYVVGPIMVGVGALLMYGGISAKLPAMIAALFDPTLLVTSKKLPPRPNPTATPLSGLQILKDLL